MSDLILLGSPVIATVKAGANAGREVEVVGFDKSCQKFHYNWPNSGAVGWLTANELVLPKGYVFTANSIVPDAEIERNESAQHLLLSITSGDVRAAIKELSPGFVEEIIRAVEFSECKLTVTQANALGEQLKRWLDEAAASFKLS